MSHVSIGGRSMSVSGRFRKVETVLGNGDTITAASSHYNRKGRQKREKERLLLHRFPRKMRAERNGNSRMDKFQSF